MQRFDVPFYTPGPEGFQSGTGIIKVGYGSHTNAAWCLAVTASSVEVRGCTSNSITQFTWEAGDSQQHKWLHCAHENSIVNPSTTLSARHPGSMEGSSSSWALKHYEVRLTNSDHRATAPVPINVDEAHVNGQQGYQCNIGTLRMHAKVSFSSDMAAAVQEECRLRHNSTDYSSSRCQESSLVVCECKHDSFNTDGSTDAAPALSSSHMGMIIGGAAAVVLLGGGVYFVRRRNQQQTMAEAGEFEEEGEYEEEYEEYEYEEEEEEG